MPKLLLVEDNELNRDMLSRRLQRRGYVVILAADGARGLELARSESPDLILMDLSVPVIDGWEAIRRLKQDPATRAIPIVALTAHAMAGEEERARSAGCDDFDTKPIDLTRLLGKITAWLGPVPNPVVETGSVQAVRTLPPLELRLPADRGSLEQLGSFVLTSAARFGLDQELASRLRLAIEEVAVNVIDHGYAGGDPGTILVRLVRGPGTVTATIEDQAPLFDPASVPPPRLDVDWQDRSVGGLGWHLVRKVMDDVRHEPIAGGGNRVTLVARLSAAPR